MFHTLDEFFSDWRQEREKTERVFGALTDDALGQRISAEGRRLETLAWHIVTSITDMMSHIGLRTGGPEPYGPEPGSAEKILAAYRELTASLEQQLRREWDDASLQQEHDLYGQKWKNVQTLHILIRHEVHHRAQLTVLMRQAGLRVPGVYGPSREEWSDMGREPQP